MLTIEGFAGIGRGVISAEVSQVLVRDSSGSPIFLAVEHGPQVFYSKVGDDDFDELIRQLGLSVTVVSVRPKS